MVGFKTLNRVGWSDLSPILSFTAGKLPSPPSVAPVLIQPLANSVEFSWTPSTDIGGASFLDYYNIYLDGVTPID